MTGLFGKLGALLSQWRGEYPDLDQSRLQEAEALLAQNPVDEKDLESLCKRLEQAFGYDYLRKPSAHFNGSLEERIEVLCHELREAGQIKRFGFLISVFPDYAIVCEGTDDYTSYYGDDAAEPRYFKVPYTIDADHTNATFGVKEEVDLQMIAVPVAQAAEQGADTTSDGSGDAQEQDAADEADDRPDWLKQGLEPPGGDEDLTQTQTYILQATEYDEKSKVLKVQGTATTANVVNTKKQVYPIEVWQDNLPRLQRLLEQGRLVGESEHPEDGRNSLDKTCIKFTKYWQDGNEFKFEANILPTVPYGQNLQTLIQNGVAVDISSRGRGTTKSGEWNGVKGVAIVQRGFRCDGFDAVIAGASPGSTITNWEIAQSETVAAQDTQEEEIEMDPKLLAQLQALAANSDKLQALITQMEQGAKATPETPETKTEEVKTETVTQSAAPTEGELRTIAAAERSEKAAAAMELSLARGAVEPLVQATIQAKNWAPVWGNTLRKRIDQGFKNGHVKDLDTLTQFVEAATGEVDEMVQAAPKFPGGGFTVQPDAGARGPKTPMELIDILCEGVPDELPASGMEHFAQRDENGNPLIPGDFRTPKRQLKRILTNIAKHQDEEWNGPAAITALTRLAQGYDPYRVQEDFLNQACADGTTAVGAGGAPQSAIFIFPLVRRVFPLLIATELASVQPMDRPDGKIFFLDAYRVSTGVNSVDEGGNTISDRMRIDRSDSFSDSYADDPGECTTANLLQLRLSSKSVQAQNKKLYAQWSIEEMQDLRAYHGLDAQGELVSSLAREIALEWNQIVLQEMLDGATAGNRTFATTAPSGYSGPEWEKYISRYIDALSNDIFRKRHGDITHLIAGPNAWLKLGAAFSTGTNPRSGPEPEMYAGLTLTPFFTASMPGLKTYKTSFWGGVNSDKILVLRRGADWSDTPYVWAPYMDYVSQTLTLPDVFTQKQGIMSRVAHKVVVGDAMATLTIGAGTGVPL
jgi:hypothetical protein